MAENISLPDIEIDVDGFPMLTESILTPPQAEIFKRPSDEFKYDQPKPGENTPITETPSVAAEQKALLDSIVSDANGSELPTLEERPSATGKPKTDKNALVEYIKEKIETKNFVTFDDYDEKVPVDEYLSKLSNKDLNSLIDENLKLKEDSFKKEIPAQFYDSLSPDAKIVYEYEANGGTDFKSLYKALSEVRQLNDLDPSKEDHQEEIVYEYLRNANADWNDDEVKSQVEEWKDLGLIEKKALQLKPKLDRMKEQIVQYQLEEQRQLSDQRRQAAEQYVNNVYTALKPAEIGGLKIDAKTQTSLYNGLVNANYKSVTGGQTNELGHLLEKFQYSEPNYQKIAKVLWILKDEEGYESALMKKGANAKVEDTVKKLKTEQGNRSSSPSFDESGNSSRQVKITRAASPFKWEK